MIHGKGLGFPDAVISAYNAINPNRFTEHLSMRLEYRSVANPDRDNLMVEFEYMDVESNQLLRVSFFHVVDFNLEKCGPNSELFPLAIADFTDAQWSDVAYRVASEHDEVRFYCADFAFIVIPKRDYRY